MLDATSSSSESSGKEGKKKKAKKADKKIKSEDKTTINKPTVKPQLLKAELNDSESKVYSAVDPSRVLRVYKLKKGQRRGQVMPYKELLSDIKNKRIVIVGED